MTLHVRGKCSWFGGPDDEGVAPDEGLAFIAEVEQQPAIFLPEQPPGTTGLARRLNPKMPYVACRWDYDDTPAFMLLEEKALVHAAKTGKQFLAYPADWGPNENTGRVADISPGLMDALGIDTDDVVEVTFPHATLELPEQRPVGSVVISSGHGLHVRGASGLIDEVDEARRVVERVADDLRTLGLDVVVFHDDTSTTQQENLETIVDFHNRQARDLDVSVHFNANVETDSPMGTECLYISQEELADKMASAIAKAGHLHDRGPKERNDLYFLNHTEMPAILIEVCFVDSTADVDAYEENFSDICTAIAGVLGNEDLVS